jgi:hypothetical protein
VEALLAESDFRRVQRRLQREFAQSWRWRRMIWRTVAMMVSRPMVCEMIVDVMKVTDAGEWFVRMAKHGGQCPPHATNEAR